MIFCINSCCHAEMLISVKQALSALPLHEITCEILEGQNPHRCFQNKKPKDSFNFLGQKGLYPISSTTNYTAVAVISLAHLEELIHKGCQVVLKFFYVNFTKCILSRCSYCFYTTNVPRDKRPVVKGWKLKCIPGILEKERETEKGQTIWMKHLSAYVFSYS